MRPRRFRIPMFAKFLIGCLALAALLIIGGTYVVKNESKQRVTGNYLQQAARRLAGYIDSVGRNVSGIADIYSADPELRRAVAASAAPAPAPAPAPPAPGAPPAVEPPRASTTVTERGRQLYEQIRAPEKTADSWALDPDVFAIFTTSNRLLYASPKSPLVEGDLAQLGAVAHARNGNVFAHRIQLLRGVPYVISAFPMRHEGQIVGGILIGILLEDVFREWSKQTDADPIKQMRPTLLDGVTVLASAWPDANAHPEVARAVQPEKHYKIEVFGSMRPVVNIGNEVHDVWNSDFEGYKGLENGKIGQLYMTRNRAAQPPTHRCPSPRSSLASSRPSSSPCSSPTG